MTSIMDCCNILLFIYPQVPQLVSYPVVNVTTNKKSHGKVSLCLLQKSSGGVDMDVWAIDDLTLLPLLPKESKEDGNKVLQATVNLQCGKEAEKQTRYGTAEFLKNSILLEIGNATFYKYFICCYATFYKHLLRKFFSLNLPKCIFKGYSKNNVTLFSFEITNSLFAQIIKN